MKKTFFKRERKKEKLSSCSFSSRELVINQNGEITSKCLFPKDCHITIDDEFNFLWIDTEKITNRLANIKKSFNESYKKEICYDCLNSGLHFTLEEKNKAPIRRLHLSHWKCCPLNCLYCKRERVEDLSNEKHYDIMPVIKQLLDNKIIDKETQIVFDCGDATVHGDFDKLMYFFIDYGMKDIIVYSSAMRFCQSVADAIGKNIATLIVPIDGSNRFMFNKIKRLDKYTIIMLNINRYLMYEDKNQNRVQMKYTLIEGINDNTEEITQFYLLAKNANIKKFYFDIEDKWFEDIKYSVPVFILEIISFVKKLGEINNYEIEFSDKIKYLYSRKNS